MRPLEPTLTRSSNLGSGMTALTTLSMGRSKVSQASSAGPSWYGSRGSVAKGLSSEAMGAVSSTDAIVSRNNDRHGMLLIVPSKGANRVSLERKNQYFRRKEKGHQTRGTRDNLKRGAKENSHFRGTKCGSEQVTVD